MKEFLPDFFKKLFGLLDASISFIILQTCFHFCRNTFGGKKSKVASMITVSTLKFSFRNLFPLRKLRSCLPRYKKRYRLPELGVDWYSSAIIF